MYRNILVPVALGDQERSAKELAKARALLLDGGEVTLVHVAEPIPVYVTSYIAADIMTQSHASMSVELEELAAANGPAKIALIEGHAGRSIVDLAKTQGADLIVMAAHRPGFEDLFVGSTTAHVTRHAPCSVLVVR